MCHNVVLKLVYGYESQLFMLLVSLFLILQIKYWSFHDRLDPTCRV